MDANFTRVLLFALFCCNTLLASGLPVSPTNPSVLLSGGTAPHPESRLRPRILPRDDNSNTTTTSGGGSGRLDSPLPANLIAAIAATGVGVILVLVGLMSAFRMGWSRGLEYQGREERKLNSSGSSDIATDPTLVPWHGEPPIIRGMSERDINNPYKVVVGALGRHSFKPGKGVYEIHDPQEPRATRHERVGILSIDKGKEKSIGSW